MNPMRNQQFRVTLQSVAEEDHQEPADVPHGRQRIEPTVEGYLNWLIERCCRRRDGAATTERRLLYEELERVTIWHGLKFAVEGPDAGVRAAALRTLGQMSHIGDDEESMQGSMRTTLPWARRWLPTISSRHCSLVHHQARDSVQTLIPCTTRLVPADMCQEVKEMMQMKVQSQVVKVKPAHRSFNDTVIHRWMKYPIPSFGWYFIMDRMMIAWRLMATSLEECPVLQACFRMFSGSDECCRWAVGWAKPEDNANLREAMGHLP